MELELTEEQDAVAAVARSLGMDVLSPAARDAEASRTVPDAVRKALFETGITIPVDERHGGGGIPDAVTQMIAIESLAYGDPGITMASVWCGAVALLIGQCGTDQQRASLLPSFANDADRRSAVALYEGHGRGPAEYSTTISRAADGRWRVRGRKLAVAGAHTATPIVVVGVDPGDGRLRAAVVEPGDAGIAIEDGHSHLALDAAAPTAVTFNVEISADRLVGSADDDQSVLAAAVGRIRLAAAAASLGTAQRAVDYSAEYAQERIAFGKPIAAFQGVSFMLADASIRLSAARLETLDVAARIEARTEPPAELERSVTNAVNYAGVVATESTRDAIQVLGGHGFITDHPVELWYRAAATLSSLDFDPLCSAFEPAL